MNFSRIQNIVCKFRGKCYIRSRHAAIERFDEPSFVDKTYDDRSVRSAIFHTEPTLCFNWNLWFEKLMTVENRLPEGKHIDQGLTAAADPQVMFQSFTEKVF